ncbi:MAG: DNA-binding LytR/AlgR family response regulator [Flavobacteriales bacterium]|jgi:DNA-binding LytR/AlgR family response regulator
MKQMNCIIVDDEELSRLAVRKCVEQTKSLKLIGEFDNALDAAECLKTEKIDLIFLDIEMPEMSGMEFIENFDVPQIILITSKKEFAIEAFEFDVTDYIIKPLELGRFNKAVEKAGRVFDAISEPEINTPYVFVKKDSRLIKIFLSDILYVEALADYVNIYAKDGRFTILSTMKAIDHKLPSDQFARVHRSFIVRMDHIVEIEDNTVVINDKLIPVSRSYKENLMKRLKTL